MSPLQQFGILWFVLSGCLTEIIIVVDGGRFLSTSVGTYNLSKLDQSVNRSPVNTTAQFGASSHSKEVNKIGVQNLAATNGNGSCGVQQESKVCVARTLVDIYRGASGCISVNRPAVMKGQSSSARISIKSISHENEESIEAGLMVNPSLHGDNSTYVYIRWTGKDSCSGCYNLECPGFVNTNKDLDIASLDTDHVSVEDGTQYCLFVEISMDNKTGDWWLKVTDENTKVGYWPSNIFEKLTNGPNLSETIIEWGGEVRYPKGSVSPEMGSGRPPSDGFRKAAFVRDLDYIDFLYEKLSVADATDLVSLYSDSNGCYGIENTNPDSDWGYNFYYGGPGYC